MAAQEVFGVVVYCMEDRANLATRREQPHKIGGGSSRCKVATTFTHHHRNSYHEFQ